jgi:NitT/TauT family transport system permease protein
VPPLAILPILFIIFGVDETGKIALIFLGSVWFISRDIFEYVSAIPKEQIVKALTFNASVFGLVRRVILPQVMPRLIDALRLTLGAAWLFLIAAEAIASTDGLGYRIFLVRRYLAMDIIIPYVAVITLTGFILDFSLKSLLHYKYPWYVARKRT